MNIKAYYSCDVVIGPQPDTNSKRKEIKIGPRLDTNNKWREIKMGHDQH